MPAASSKPGAVLGWFRFSVVEVQTRGAISHWQLVHYLGLSCSNYARGQSLQKNVFLYGWMCAEEGAGQARPSFILLHLHLALALSYGSSF